MTESVLLAAGCFWGVQHRLKAVPGVLSTRVGYARARGSSAPEAECVRVTFDPEALGLEALLAAFFASHDPTRARPAKYRSAVFAADERQLARASAFVASFQASHVRPVLTEVALAGLFRDADERHQDWMEKRGAGRAA